MNHDLYNFSRTKLHGKSMGEFGPTDTTRKIGRQGWKVKTETNPRKKKRNRKSLSRLWNFLKTIRATK
jgi:hypothetical protein